MPTLYLTHLTLQEELVSLVSILHDHAVDKSITRSIEEFDTNRDGVVSFPELCALHKNYPQVLFPAFRIQANLMLATFGQSYWVKRREVRSHLRMQKALFSPHFRSAGRVI